MLGVVDRGGQEPANHAGWGIAGHFALALFLAIAARLLAVSAANAAPAITSVTFGSSGLAYPYEVVFWTGFARPRPHRTSHIWDTPALTAARPCTSAMLRRIRTASVPTRTDVGATQIGLVKGGGTDRSFEIRLGSTNLRLLLRLVARAERSCCRLCARVDGTRGGWYAEEGAAL